VSTFGRYFIDNPADLLGFIIFNVNGLFFSVIGEIMKRVRKRMAATLRQSHRLEKALDRIPAYIYMKDKNQRYVYANQLTLDLFNCSATELIGKQDDDFFPEDTAKRLKEIDKRVLDDGESTAEEIISRDQEDKPVIYWELKTPIFDEMDNTRIWGLCGISTDITERKNKEDALRESEENFRSVFNSSALGMALVSIEGRFIQTNSALCQMIGYTELEELLLKNPSPGKMAISYITPFLSGLVSLKNITPKSNFCLTKRIQRFILPKTRVATAFVRPNKRVDSHHKACSMNRLSLKD